MAKALDVNLLPQSKDRKNLIHRAALHLFESIDGEERVAPLEDTESRRFAFKFRLDHKNHVRTVTLLGTLLTFIEKPRWCKLFSEDVKVLTDHPCSSDLYPSYPLPFLTKYENLVPELLIFAFILLDNLLLIHALGFDRALSKGRMKSRCLVLALNFADICHAYLLGGYEWYRFAPYCRVFLFISYSHEVATRLELIWNMLREVLDVVFIVIVFLFMFAWFGVLLFPKDTAEGQAFFNGIGNGMWSLLVLITTANFPDIMMPAYKVNRGAFLFFLAFVILGVFLLINVITAVVFNSFTDQKEQIATKKVQVRANARRKAFDLLGSIEGEPDEIGLEVTQDLFKELTHYQDIAHMSNSPDKMFHKLDEDGSGTISFAEFEQIGDALEACMIKQHRPPWLVRKYPNLKTNETWKTCKAVVFSWQWDAAIDVILVFAVCLAFAESYMDGLLSPSEPDDLKAKLHNPTKPVPITVHTFEFWNIVVSVIFVIEAIVKILFQGRDKYWSHLMNRYDFCISMTTFAVVVFTLLPNTANNPSLMRLAAMLRVGRVLRLMMHASKTFRITAETFVGILPEGIGIIKVLFCAMYLFSFLGMQLFGGKINNDPHDPRSKDIAATDYGTSDYYPNNFNDMPSGMVTLFELIVVNNWFEIVDGFSAAVSHQTLGTVWAPAFFIVWYIFGVLITMNIVVSFVLNEFVDKFKEGMLSVGQAPVLGTQAESQLQLPPAETQ